MNHKKRSRSLWDKAREPNAPNSATIRAILYELQPVRFSTVDCRPWFLKVKQCVKLIQLYFPLIIRFLISMIRKLKMKQWIIIISIWIYWQLVKWIHRKLDAGPIFIMSTIMLLIFTIGLGESKEKVDGEEEHWSAYSVFNRGCQSLLGAMNVEDLVAQHVGGGLHLGFRGQDNNDHNRDDDMGAQNRQRRRRRPEPLNNAGDVNQAAPAAVANNQARKSGKKLRRQNLELRREAQRQRQAAAAFGFGGVDETEAMNRLLEEQAAAIEVMEENDDDHDGNLAAILAVLEE